jgi:hypothetical protein
MTVDEKGKLVRLFIQGGSFTDAFDCTRNFHLLASFAIYVLKLCSVLHTGEQCCGWGYHWWEKVTYQYLKKMNIPCIILVLVINCSMKAPLKRTEAQHASCMITSGRTKCGCVYTQNCSMVPLIILYVIWVLIDFTV